MAEIWRELKRKGGFKLMVKMFVSPKQWIFEMLAACTDREATILVIAFWHIWEARNAVRNGENKMHPTV